MFACVFECACEESEREERQTNRPAYRQTNRRIVRNAEGKAHPGTPRHREVCVCVCVCERERE